MNLRTIGKAFLEKNPRLLWLVLQGYYGLPGFNRRKISGRGNRLEGSSRLKHCNISIKGNNNSVNFGDMSYLSDCKVFIVGSNNRIALGDRCNLHQAIFWIEDDGNLITVGGGTSIHGRVHLAATEGKTIAIGRDCMFSGEVAVRTGDSHSIIQMNSNIRVNPASDVSIGNHVWIGSRAIILKGSSIADHSIVATGAIVTKKHVQSNIILAGNPAASIKENIDWLRKRI